MKGFSQVLYEDNHLIAVNKLPGAIVQGDRTGDAPLSDFVKAYIKEKYEKPGEVYLGTTHRIDRPVSGIVLFARTSKALARMNELFKQRAIAKTYWALIKNAPPAAQGHLTHYLLKDEAKNKSKAFDKPVKNALLSELSYRLLAKGDTFHLLEINPLTGRHHQIRAQLAALGCPIKGDLKYGFNRSNPDESIHLHARRVEFIHPVNQELKIITAPPPDEKLWQLFTQLYEQSLPV